MERSAALSVGASRRDTTTMAVPKDDCAPSVPLPREKAKRTLQSASSLCLRVINLQPRITRFIPGATKALWPGIRVPAWATVVIVPSLYANTPMSPVDVIPSNVIWPAALIVAELALKREDPPGAASPGPAVRVRAP